jgi:hypothetical protein
MLVVAAGLMTYYLHHLWVPTEPTGDPAAYEKLLAVHKAATDQFRDSVGYVFDLTVTKTVLPIVTLLLGYLFGKKS